MQMSLLQECRRQLIMIKADNGTLLSLCLDDVLHADLLHCLPVQAMLDLKSSQVWLPLFHPCPEGLLSIVGSIFLACGHLPNMAQHQQGCLIS